MATKDEIARRVAEKLAPDVGPKLATYVEKLIALGDAARDGAPEQRIDNASFIAVASLLMSAIPIVLGRIDRWEDEQRRRSDEQQRRGEEQQRRRELEALASELREAIRAGVNFPDTVPTKVRVELIESVVEEGIEAAKRLDAKR